MKPAGSASNEGLCPMADTRVSTHRRAISRNRSFYGTLNERRFALSSSVGGPLNEFYTTDRQLKIEQ